MLGTYEYPDFPMDSATFGVQPGEHIPAAVLHQYLTKYAEHFGVFRRIRFNTTVESAEQTADGSWTLTASEQPTDDAMPIPSQLQTKKLIVATGLTSEPNMPDIPGSSAFAGLLFHSKDFQHHAASLESARHVAVLGGAKSAWDVAYAYASAGVRVDMVIRPSGKGPVWMAPPYVTPLKKWLEKLVHIRLLTWLSPCIWGDEDGYGGIRNFLHGTFLGRFFVDLFWKILSADVITAIGFDKDAEMKKLKPWHSAFWIGSGLGVLNYPTDFFALVRTGQIRVHIAEISHLSPDALHLSTGAALPCDALICATGWKPGPPIQFRLHASSSSAATAAELGLPHPLPDPHAALVEKADAEILARFPRLRAQPPVPARGRCEGGGGGGVADAAATTTPLRLYRFMVPPPLLASRSLAFAGLLTSITTSVTASAQALWVCAYFAGELERVPQGVEEARWEAVRAARWGRWRYPCGYGGRVPDFVFDAVPYLDLLLGDLGVRGRRKGGWREVVGAYGVEDYRGLVGEWKGRWRRRG